MDRHKTPAGENTSGNFGVQRAVGRIERAAPRGLSAPVDDRLSSAYGRGATEGGWNSSPQYRAVPLNLWTSYSDNGMMRSMSSCDERRMHDPQSGRALMNDGSIPIRQASSPTIQREYAGGSPLRGDATKARLPAPLRKRRAVHQNMSFYQTNPPFFGGFLVANNYEYATCTGNR